MSNTYQYTASLIRKVDIEVMCEYDADYDTVTIIHAYEAITGNDIQLEDNEIEYCRGEALDKWQDSQDADEADHRLKTHRETRGD
jgi:hypothetical protein